MMEKIIESVFRDHFGVCPRVVQVDALTKLLTARDMVVSAPVGAGKSLIYQAFPMIYTEVFHMPSSCLVISPLNIIHDDQLAYLKTRLIPSCRITMRGDLVCNMCNAVCTCTSKDIGSFKLIFAHPESIFNTTIAPLLKDETFITTIKAVFLDECHVIEKWQLNFRPEYANLGMLKGIFNLASIVAMSGTLTKSQISSIPAMLHLKNPFIISVSPDKTNIFLAKKLKEKDDDVTSQYENIFKPEAFKLKADPPNYPITIMYMPMFYMSCAVLFLQSLFGEQDISNSVYSCLYSNQDEEVTSATIQDLKSDTPRIRLILSTSVTGMGFDPPNVTRIIHSCPPRSLTQYIQEVGRCGRRGQPSKAILHYSLRDVSKNLDGLENNIVNYVNSESCLRSAMLLEFGFSKTNIKCKDCCSICELKCSCGCCSN